MKPTFVILALAALVSAKPHQHKRGGNACPAKSTYNKDSTSYDSGNKGDNSNSGHTEPEQPVYEPTKDTTSSMSCPNDGGKTLAGSGSCKCDFAVNCDAKADYSTSAKFWERTNGEVITSLAECVKICDENSQCQATIWVADSTSSDYQHCWQTSGLGGVTGSGQGQISYKGACSGSCGESYMNLS